MYRKSSIERFNMRKQSTKSSRTISDTKLAELKENARAILADCRGEMLSNMPFIGSVAMNLTIVPTRDRRLETAACDGRNIFFDIDFLSRLKKDEITFVLAHEVWHAVMSHMLRLESRDMKLFNYAADMEVNEILRQENYHVLKNAVTAKSFKFEDGLSAEEYYELLLKDADKIPNSSNPNNGSSSSSSSSSGNPTDGDGQFDKHLYEGQNAFSDDVEGEVDDKYGKVEYDDDYQPAVSKEAVAAIQEAVVSAAQRLEAQGRGLVPAYVQRILEKILEPVIPWQEVLSQFVTRQIGSDANWNKPHRRFVSRGLYLPTHESNCLNIAVGIDTSGSTASDMEQFIGELNGILSTVDEYELHLVECDTQVGKYEVHTPMNPINFEAYQVTGGGGTIINPIFEKLHEEDVDISCAVIFTDGETEHFSADMDPGYPVLWVISGKPNDRIKENFEFGEVVFFNQD